MSELIQIPNNINLQLETLLFGQNPNFESGKFTLEDLKNFLDNYFSNSNNGGGSGNSNIYVGSAPPESPIDGAKWMETDQTGIFINEWTYGWLGNDYYWFVPSAYSIADIVSNTSLYPISLIDYYDYLIKDIEVSYRLVTGGFTVSSRYSIEIYHSVNNVLSSFFTHQQSQYTPTFSYSFFEENINYFIQPGESNAAFRDSPNSSQSLGIRVLRESSTAITLAFSVKLNFFKLYRFA